MRKTNIKVFESRKSMRKKYLIVKGCAGLGNRIYTLSNALNYANKTGRILLVDWSDGQFAPVEQNAFDLFFEIKNYPIIHSLNEIEKIEGLSVFPTEWKKHLNSAIYDHYESADINLLRKMPSRLMWTFPRLSMKTGYWRKLGNKVKSDFANFIDPKNFIKGEYYSKNIKQDVVVFVDFSPKYYENIVRCNIQLKESTSNKINDFANAKNLQTDCIGIHIRYTDKKPDASFEKLYERIEKIGMEGKKIFLSTDNREIEKMMKEKYHHIITFPKFLPDEQKEGLHQWALYNKDESAKVTMFEESIIDMWLLSKCEYLIFQENSSFSQISRILKNDTKSFGW